MTTLVIVESPGKVKKIAAVLGPDYRVKASVGHVRDLPKDELGIELPDFELTYVPTDRGAEILDSLKPEVAKAERVLLATDPDREGEAIAWHLADALKLKNPGRITFTAITPEKIMAALAEPRSIDVPRVRAQEARRALDRIVGYRVSSALSNRAGQKLSAGRVQSPALRLIVDREREIRAFQSTQHFGAELLFQVDDKTTWKAQWETKTHLAEGQKYLLDNELARRAASIRNVTVTAFEDGPKGKAPPAPFTTSTMQQAAGRRLKYNETKTMDLAQKLYEAGHITYHRTDAPNLDAAGVADIAAYAQGAGLRLAEKPRTWKAKEGAQEGHEAIRPAHADVLDAGDTDEQRALYKLIWQRAVASQLADAVYAVRKATLTGSDAGTAFVYTASGRTLTDPGWMTVYAAAGADEDDEKDGKDEMSNPVPALAQGQAVTASDGRLLTKHTEPPSRIKRTDLGPTLEKLGIGRPSTFAATLANILGRAYVEEDKKGFLLPTQLGEAVRDALVGNFAFADLDYTRNLEEQLDHIAEGQADYRSVVGAAWQGIDGELSAFGAAAVSIAPAHPCPTCGKALARRKGQYGFFWSCTDRECKTTLPDAKGKPGERKPAAAPEASGYTCPVVACGGAPLARRTGTSKPTGKGKSAKPGKAYDFYSCTKCRTIYNVKDDKPVFPDSVAAQAGG